MKIDVAQAAVSAVGIYAIVRVWFKVVDAFGNSIGILLKAPFIEEDEEEDEDEELPVLPIYPDEKPPSYAESLADAFEEEDENAETLADASE